MSVSQSGVKPAKIQRLDHNLLEKFNSKNSFENLHRLTVVSYSTFNDSNNQQVVDLTASDDETEADDVIKCQTYVTATGARVTVDEGSLLMRNSTPNT